MLTDAVAWVCRSPRRLAVTAVVVIAAVLLGSGLANALRGDAPPAEKAVTAQVPDSNRYVSSAVAFVQDWAQLPSGGDQAQWLARLTPLVTPELAAALRTTDPAELPGARPTGEPVVRFVAQSSALVAVPLSDGSSVLVTVIENSSGTQVSDIQPDAGDG